MSQATTMTQYQVQHNVVQTATGNTDTWWCSLSLSSWNDAAIAAFVQALEALPLPAGCTSQVIVSKSVQVSTTYTTNMATNPIAFT